MPGRNQQRVIVLGSGPALTSARRDNTSFFFDSPGGGLFIECGGSPLHKLLKAGVEPGRVRGVVLTHAHADHSYGLPSLVQELWLLGRREPLHIYANAATQQAAVAVLDVFRLREKRMPVEFHSIPDEEGFLVLENDFYALQSSPVKHEVPALAIKIISRRDDRVAVYSGDTSPCRELVALAEGADLLFHECTEEEAHPVHSTPHQVGEIASEADVKELILVHCHPNLVKEPYVTIATIRKIYRGPVRFAEDSDVYEL